MDSRASRKYTELSVSEESANSSVERPMNLNLHVAGQLIGIL
jgi:hypothetical protein